MKSVEHPNVVKSDEMTPPIIEYRDRMTGLISQADFNLSASGVEPQAKISEIVRVYRLMDEMKARMDARADVLNDEEKEVTVRLYSQGLSLFKNVIIKHCS